MSVKFQQETVRDAPIPGLKKDGVAHNLGERLTGGETASGYLAVSKIEGNTFSALRLTNPLRQAYLQQLQDNPLRTKMLTSGSLAALQEVLASWIARDVSKHGHYINSRVPKMAVYGAFISAPLGHLLISILQRVFSGRTSLRAKITQIIVSNLIVRPSLAQALQSPKLKYALTVDRAHPEYSLPCFDGRHRRCKDVSPDTSHR